MNESRILGMMSGTSLDGLDLAFCKFTTGVSGWSFEILEAESISYNQELRNRLKEAIAFSAPELISFHNTYGQWLGERAKEFIDKHDIRPDAIASHGHTIHHQPEAGFTFQLGNGQYLANAVGYKTIADFRSGDVALGGQGAPLVPIGDLHLFSEYDFCLNLGGISNISFQKEGHRIAFDIGIANMALNGLSRQRGLEYDDKGEIAASGKVHRALLKALNELEYYRLPYPKSTGYEWYKSKIVPLLAELNIPIQDKMRTCVEHITDQIALQLSEIATPQPSRLLVTGGGALNTFLISLLRQKLPPQIDISVPDQQLINFKEALVFAFMGLLRLKNQPNILASVTGAKRDSTGGILYMPD